MIAKYIPSAISENKKPIFFFIFVVWVCFTILAMRLMDKRQTIFMPVNLDLDLDSDWHPSLNLKCPNVLERMVSGKWIKRAHTQVDLDEIQSFLNKTRGDLKIPLTLEREDKKCGAHNLPHTLWLRGLCNPNGSNPCCYNNTCVSRTEENCRCPNCFDMRQRIHAELATWVPSDPTCQMTKFVTVEETCKVLHNMTIYFIGDSFMRQVYTSVLEILRSSEEYGSLRKSAPKATLEECDKYYRFASHCRLFIMLESQECNNTVRLKIHTMWKAANIEEALRTMRELTGQPNSLIFFNTGLHDAYDFERIKHEVLDPVFELLSKSPWPKLLWMSCHTPGLLKTSQRPEQQTPTIYRYNSRVGSYMKKRGVPVIDFFKLTRGVVSYDGSHFGKGVDDVKAQIFLNYLMELRLNSTQFSPLL